MNIEHRYRKANSVTFAVPDNRLNRERTFSFTESDLDYEPTFTTINPKALAMAKTLRNIRRVRISWDSDNALKSTYKGIIGMYQLRVFIFLALGYGIIGAWLTEMPAFALLPPKYIDCTPYYSNIINASNQSWTELNTTTARASNQNTRKIMIGRQTREMKPVYNYSNEYGRSALIDFRILCNRTQLKIPYFVYIIGLILGGLVFGCLADHSGRKMILLGSMWTACALSIFQLLSVDYISYVFFILFIGIAIGAVQVIAIPYTMEMFPTKSRAIYGLLLLGTVFLLDLVIPWLALWIKNWKVLQAVITLPLILTAPLYWFAEESMFWFTTQKDYVAAVLSLTKIARFNGIVFEDVFREARGFLYRKQTKGIQCDLQPFLRLEDVKLLNSKYPDFDMVELQATADKRNTFSQRMLRILKGHDYDPTLSAFYPSDIFHSYILTFYLFIMCGLWLVSSLTEYSLDSPQLTRHLTDNFFHNYFYTHLIQVISFIVALPMVYRWGRRWPTFCFFLIAEVCLLGSVAVRLDNEQTRSAMVAVYFIGKFATRAGFIVIIIYTCEIFPTGLRCTTLGICYTFRLIGVALASPDLGELNYGMARLIYGILSLILGAMALLLPETRKLPLPRTILHVDNIPTAISRTFRKKRSIFVKKDIRSDDTRPEGGNMFSDTASVHSGIRSNRLGPYDNQSTSHSIYELQEYGQDDTVHSSTGRNPSRRVDSRNPLVYQPYSVISSDMLRRQQSIPEGGEYDDDNNADGSRTRSVLQQRQFAAVQTPVVRTDDGDNILPITTSPAKRPSTHLPSQLDITAQIQSGDVAGDHSVSIPTNDNINQDENLSRSPRHRRTMSQDENYFSEHC